MLQITELSLIFAFSSLLQVVYSDKNIDILYFNILKIRKKRTLKRMMHDYLTNLLFYPIMIYRDFSPLHIIFLKIILENCSNHFAYLNPLGISCS